MLIKMIAEKIDEKLLKQKVQELKESNYSKNLDNNKLLINCESKIAELRLIADLETCAGALIALNELPASKMDKLEKLIEDNYLNKYTRLFAEFTVMMELLINE